MKAFGWLEQIPGLVAVRTYQRAWISKDVGAGLVLSALLVPQGMAYAELAGLPAVTGLYTSILCLIGYAIFGPSRVLVLGPDSSLGPMIAATILPLAGARGDPAKAVAYASMIALMTGAIMLIAGLGRFGFVADLLSKPTILGYMNGLALTIVVGQIPKLLGFSVEGDGLIGEIRGVVHGIANGKVVPAAAAVGLISLALILLLPRISARLPVVLITVVAAMLAALALDLGSHGVKLVGKLPQGLPHPALPVVGVSNLVPLLVGALGIALVALTDTISTATSFADRRGDDVNGDKEMVGIGAANVAAGFFQGFAVSTSGSRTAVAEQAGAKSQLTGLVGAVVIATMLLAVPGLFAYLPQPTLGAVVIAAAISLASVGATRRLLQQRRTDFAISIAAFLGVALLGVLAGILIAVAISVLNVFRRLWWPHQALLGRVPGTPGLHDVGDYPNAQQLPGCRILRFDAPLIFANARTFRDRVRQLSDSLPPEGWIVVAAEPITDVDTTACAMLAELDGLLRRRGQRLVFAEMKSPTRAKFSQYGLTDQFSSDQFYPTLHSAVDAFRAQSDSEWRS